VIEVVVGVVICILCCCDCIACCRSQPALPPSLTVVMLLATEQPSRQGYPPHGYPPHGYTRQPPPQGYGPATSTLEILWAAKLIWINIIVIICQNCETESSELVTW
jgi:hypothetical protein